MQNKIATALAKAVLKPRNRAIHENGVRSALLKPDPCFPNPLNLHQELPRTSRLSQTEPLSWVFKAPGRSAQVVVTFYDKGPGFRPWAKHQQRW
jgi:hypothetical protein